MKLKGILTGMCLSLALVCSAQDVENVVPQPVDEGAEPASAPLQEAERPGSPLHSYYEPIGGDVRPGLPGARRHLPLTAGYGYTGGLWHYPLSWDEWCGWGLHKGLNVSIGASVFGEVGKHTRHGVGFAQSLSALYVAPLTDRLSLAVGGYMNNVYWAHSNYREAGVSALLNYRFDEHWEAFVYGKKSLLNDRLVPRPLYDMHALGDVVGGGVRYNFSPSFSVEVSVNYGTNPAQRESARDVYHSWK